MPSDPQETIMRSPSEPALRRAMRDACRDMNRLGINQGTSGNVSMRLSDAAFLVTPTGVPYDRLRPEMMVRMAFDGGHDGRIRPSSEWRFHRDILAARPEIGAVVHCHAMFATTLAIARKDIPAVHYMIAAAGGASIRCARYATFGTQALSEHALAALDGRNACLLANHGMIALGHTLERALWLAVEVEALAAQYWRVLQIGGGHVLPRAEIARVMAAFAEYGHQPGLRRPRAAPARLDKSARPAARSRR
jgi:L-fuculose-phosphate aldolase